METKTKSRLTSYNFWVKLASAVILILRIVLSKFGIEIDSAFILDIATLVAGVLVILGIINEPTGITISYKNQESEVNENMGNEQNFKTQIEEKLNEVRNIFSSFGIEDEDVVNAKLEQINGFLVSLFNTELKSIETLSNLLNDEKDVNSGEKTETEGVKHGNIDVVSPKNDGGGVMLDEVVIDENGSRVFSEDNLVDLAGDKQIIENDTDIVVAENNDDKNALNTEIVEEKCSAENLQIEIEEVEKLEDVEVLEEKIAGEGAILDSPETLLTTEISEGAKSDSSAVQMIKTLESELCGENSERKEVFTKKLSELIENNLNIFE